MKYIDKHNKILSTDKLFWNKEKKFWNNYGKIYFNLEESDPYKEMLLEIKKIITGDNIVRKKIYKNQLEEAGITIGEADVWNEVVNAPFVQNNPQYQNEAGLFDENKFFVYFSLALLISAFVISKILCVLL